MKRYCENGKEIFSTRGDAQRALNNMRRHRKTVGSVYFCDSCQGYHITHYNYQYGKNLRTKSDPTTEPKKPGQ